LDGETGEGDGVGVLAVLELTGTQELRCEAEMRLRRVREVEKCVRNEERVE
jgi:hypothetical protein